LSIYNYDAAGDIRFGAGNSETVRFHNNGNVGIGTSGPSEALHISRSTANIRLTDTDTGADGYILTNSTVGGMILSADGNNEVAGSYMDFFVDGTRFMRLDDNGSVGIGDATPDGALKLDVQGSVGAVSYCDQNGANCVVAGALGGGDDLGNHTATTNLNLNDLQLLNVRQFQLKDLDDDTGGADNKVRYFARDGAHTFYDGGVVVGRYSNDTWTDVANGNLIVQNQVGVGVSDPLADLHIDSGTGDTSILLEGGTEDIAVPDGQILQVGHLNTVSGAFTDRFRIAGNGNIGINEASPGAKLDVNGDIHADYIGRRTHSSGMLVGGYNNIGASSVNTNPIFTIGSNYQPSDTALNNMYGIGYTNAGTAPFITGNASGWGMYVAADGDARTFLSGAGTGNSYINSEGGNVGIRTDSPTHALHVDGQARIPEVIFAPNNNGASDKSSIVGAGGVVQIYSDSTIDFYESDNNTREFRFNVGSGDFDFSGNLRRTAGTLKCPTGEVMVGFNTAGMICEEPTIIYN